jgi:hypothetical protein
MMTVLDSTIYKFEGQFAGHEFRKLEIIYDKAHAYFAKRKNPPGKPLEWCKGCPMSTRDSCDDCPYI